MSDLKMISPLLDDMVVEKEPAGHNGRTCYTLRRLTSGERFILKRISIPANDGQVRALILSGAYADEEAVQAYYGSVVESIKAELNAGRKLAASGSFAGALDYQIERRETGVGYDIYILYPLYISLTELMNRGVMTTLRAVNLGIDLCDAISACREAGYLFGNLKPDNIFLTPTGRFLLGDLGLVSLEDLKYACLPEEYIGPYSAPELSDITASLNPTVDLYSLGMVLHRIYNGNHSPFEDEQTGEAMADKLRLTGKPLPTPIYADYELAAIILQACAFRPEDRFQTAEELKQALMLYMQRNEVADTLLVPPIVAPEVPLAPETAREEPEDEPVRMTDSDTLDEDFRRSFTPDTTGSGSEDDIDKTIVLPEPKAVAAQQTAPATPTDPQPEAPAPRAPIDWENIDMVDPDQIDFDELLASVDEVVGSADEKEPEAQPVEPSEQPEKTAQPEEAQPEEPMDEPPAEKSGKKAGAVIGRLAIILALLAAIGALAYFVITWYFVGVNTLELLSCTTQEAAISLGTEDSADKFVLSCTDNYGNSYPVSLADGRYIVSGLREKTPYTVTVSAADFHALTSASTVTLSFTTPEATNITEFTASRGDADGEVLLSFQSEGPQPASWKLSYSNAAGDDAKEYLFEGNSYLVTGLALNETYIFTLGADEGYYLSGSMSVQYELLPIVEVKNLNIADIEGSKVTVTWDAGENLPEEWTVTCEADGRDSVTQTTRQTSCTLELDTLDRDCIIRVAARGMDKPQTLVLPANPIVVSNLRGVIAENGDVTISWQTPAGEPTGGWYVSYNTADSLHVAYIANEGKPVGEENSVVLTNLIPNAEYIVTLSPTAQDVQSQIFGRLSCRFTTGESGTFDDFSLSPDAPLQAENGNILLYVEPKTEGWDYTDLDDDDQKDSFSAEESIAVCIEVNSVASSSEEVTLCYVIRDKDGRVINDVFKTLAWDDMWYSRRHASVIPLPGKTGMASTAGDYTLEIYVNGLLLASTGFTIA